MSVAPILPGHIPELLPLRIRGSPPRPQKQFTPWNLIYPVRNRILPDICGYTRIYTNPNTCSRGEGSLYYFRFGGKSEGKNS